jgi:hypothetical protein
VDIKQRLAVMRNNEPHGLVIDGPVLDAFARDALIEIERCHKLAADAIAIQLTTGNMLEQVRQFAAGNRVLTENLVVMLNKVQEMACSYMLMVAKSSVEGAILMNIKKLIADELASDNISSDPYWIRMLLNGALAEIEKLETSAMNGDLTQAGPAALERIATKLGDISDTLTLLDRIADTLDKACQEGWG